MSEIDVLAPVELPPRASNPDVRVRFCPSPTGNPHVGMVRTALFNWAYARHTGGTFVFRIEDTDTARDSEASYRQLLSALAWLGLDWDEGEQVGGPHGPYRQSQRGDIYTKAAADLLAAGRAYECFCTPGELEERRERRPPRGPHSGLRRALPAAEPGAAGFYAEGGRPALRFRMPDRRGPWEDLVRGEVSFAAEHVPDFVLVRANGEPLYTLVNPVDDALMRITHVLRGEDLLSSTPRQIALYDGLAEIGVSDGTIPKFGHLPYVMGEGNRKLSKRDPQSSLNLYREQGFLPEGLLNYLALLGWSMGEDREFFSKEQIAEAFTLDGSRRTRHGSTSRSAPRSTATGSARCLPIRLAQRVQAVLVQHGVLGTRSPLTTSATLRPPSPGAGADGDAQPGRQGMLGFLFTDDKAFAVDPDDAARMLGPTARRHSPRRTRPCPVSESWVAPRSRRRCASALIEKLALKPRVAFGSLRVATTGRRVSPPLFESLELLGRDRSLARLSAAAGDGQPELPPGRVDRRPVGGVVADRRGGRLAAFMVLAQFALLLGFVVAFLVTGADVGDKVDALSDTAHVTPSQLAYLRNSLVSPLSRRRCSTGSCMGRLRPGWVSVIGRLRWRWMAVMFGLAFVVLLAMVVVGSSCW